MAALIYEIAGDKHLISGDNATEIANNLRNGSFSPTESLEMYMEEFAQRFLLTEGIQIRYDTSSNFVDDLVQNGYLLPTN